MRPPLEAGTTAADGRPATGPQSGHCKEPNSAKPEQENILPQGFQKAAANTWTSACAGHRTSRMQCDTAALFQAKPVVTGFGSHGTHPSRRFSAGDRPLSSSRLPPPCHPTTGRERTASDCISERPGRSPQQVREMMPSLVTLGRADRNFTATGPRVTPPRHGVMAASLAAGPFIAPFIRRTSEEGMPSAWSINNSLTSSSCLSVGRDPTGCFSTVPEIKDTIVLLVSEPPK